MKNNARCSICNEPYGPNELVEFDGQMLCLDCFERETVICRHCGDRLWEDDNAGSDEFPLCECCYNARYTNCSRCGRLLHESDAYFEDDTPYCDDCHAEYRNSRPIRDYYYKPAPIFYGEGSRFMGVELEIDGAGERDDYAAILTELANSGGLELVYIKHDGSLDDGLEIVTHPMTLDYHQNEMPWGKLLEKAKELGYLSHQAGTCGLHVHVNRTAFGQTVREQETCIARVLFLVEKFWEELLIFSRRTQRQMNRWAARYGYKDIPKEILDHVKKGDHQGRYTAVNLENTDTSEFRMFRGTLKLNTFIATSQLVDRICDVAISLSDEELHSMSWPTFVTGCTQPELVQYLRERRLYVNEPVESEEEV